LLNLKEIIKSQARMLKSFFFFFFILPFCLFAEWEQLFSSDEDPIIFHHVNVMSGHLNLSIEDTKLEGPIPFNLFRTYSSSGALDRTRFSTDLVRKNLRRGFLIQGGWSFLPHANLQVIAADKSKIINFEKMKFRLSEPNGAVLAYSYSHKKKVKDHTYNYYYKPKKKAGAHTGILSVRNDPQYNILQAIVNTHHPEEFRVKVFLSNGGIRTYERLSKSLQEPLSQYYYKLLWEELPSKRHVKYMYDSKDKLTDIKIKNPDWKTTISWIHFDFLKPNDPFEFSAKTSDNRSIFYKGVEYGAREYMKEVRSPSKRKETFHYSKGGKDLGSRVSEILFEGDIEAKVHYYDSSTPLLKRDEKFYQKNFCVDKVKSLEAPVGPNGEMQTIAEFVYKPGFTEAKDVEGALTRYYYQDDRILRIEKFDNRGSRLSLLEFIWKDKQLIAKVLSNGSERPVFSKTFAYDDKGNVKEETLWGQLTGLATEESFHLTQSSNGMIIGAESCHKKYEYEPESNLLICEIETLPEGVLSYRYSYKPETDLITRKLTLYNDQILKREFFLYDENHFLVAEIVDDGQGDSLYDISGMTEQQIKRYEINDETWLISSMSEFYLDLATCSEILIKKHIYGYDSHNLRNKEDIYDATGAFRYTLVTQYDERGHVIFQTNPLGEASTYRYNHKDHLEEIKEAGLPRKVYERDAVGRALSFDEIDDEGNHKTSFSTYDAKGRVTSQTDFSGRVTRQEYDVLGKCTATEFPIVKDDKEEVYHPRILFGYDACGNVVSHTNPRGETTHTIYNVFQKPISVTRADGTITRHIYHKNGTLFKTIEPDETEVYYTYDPFLRMTSKKIYNSKGENLSEEFWEYDVFHQKSHTDTSGLITTFSYDGSGKKISEESEGRKVFYTYDALGFLETTTYGDTSKVEIHNVQGNVVEKWETKGSLKKNHTIFHYNEKGLLKKTDRITSQGEVNDFFEYDAEGRLCQHTDPEGNTTQFLYHEMQNDLGQLVFNKITINALGYKTIEIDDASNRLISREKQDEHGRTLSLEEFFYDRAGNQTMRVSTVYLKDSPLKKITHLSKYDSMGRVIKEIEAGKKVTKYSYDSRGWIKTKTNPSGICLTYEYDGLGRILSLNSSDHTVAYRYTYGKGPYPILAEDLISNQKITRKYNSFGELKKEMSSQWTLFWDYDDLGRLIRFILPDASSINWEYSAGYLYSVTKKDKNGHPCYSHTYLKIDPNGHVEEERLIHKLGVVHTSHDLLERASIQTSKWNTHKVSYDPLGRVDRIQSALFNDKEIAYDPLNQLRKEGDKEYLFDSIGNSSIYETNDCNEVLSSCESSFSYDLDGNLKERILPNEKVLYSYDALGRLTSITSSEKKVIYRYDPFSRLFSKETFANQKVDEQFFLYEQDHEVGCLDGSGKILQLKVLGLGIAGDIGAAIAIELDGVAYAPLHDFSGNCIALISPSGELAETYKIDAFGKETTNSSPKNPWRFSSKRQEENLVFFGLRFYDLALERWLTPDPSGFSEGANLYVYVLNSPLNRLDLFGLKSFEIEQPRPVIEMRLHSIQQAMHAQGAQVQAIAIANGSCIDWYVSCGFWHQMQFSAEELATGKVNLLDHFAEIMPKEGGCIGIVTNQPGVGSGREGLKIMHKSIMDKVPEQTLCIGIQTPSVFALWDGIRALLERWGVATPTVRHTSSMLGAIADTIHKINPEMGWVDVRHSEGGVIGRRAIERLPKEQRDILKKQLFNISMAPAKNMPTEYGLEAYNLFSEKDGITGLWANEQDGLTYNVEFLECISPRSERIFWFADHGMMGSTLQKGAERKIEKIRDFRRFYDGNIR
jgi:RHS repeat-associated protein